MLTLRWIHLQGCRVPVSNVNSMSTSAAFHHQHCSHSPRYHSSLVRPAIIIGTPQPPLCRVQPPHRHHHLGRPSVICLSRSPSSMYSEFRQLACLTVHTCPPYSWLPILPCMQRSSMAGALLHECVMHHSLCINNLITVRGCANALLPCPDILTFQHRYSERLLRRHPAFLHDHTAGIPSSP